MVLDLIVAGNLIEEGNLSIRFLVPKSALFLQILTNLQFSYNQFLGIEQLLLPRSSVGFQVIQQWWIRKCFEQWLNYSWRSFLGYDSSGAPIKLNWAGSAGQRLILSSPPDCMQTILEKKRRFEGNGFCCVIIIKGCIVEVLFMIGGGLHWCKFWRCNYFCLHNVSRLIDKE